MPFMIHASVGQQTGSRNIHMDCDCGDAVCLKETPYYFFYGIADGQSIKKRGTEGGAVALNSIANYVQNYGLSNLLILPFFDEIPFLLTREFRSALLYLSQQQGYPIKEYASTLLGIAIDPISGNYMIMHLGDGCVIGVQNDHSVTMLSPPENTFSRQHTWLTTSDYAVSHLQVNTGNIHNFRRLLLLTDGAVSLCYGKNISARAKHIMIDNSPNRILEFLRKSTPKDDASCIVLDVDLLPDVHAILEQNKMEE